MHYSKKWRLLFLIYFFGLSTIFISCQNNNLFTNLPSSKTNIHFANNLEKQKAFGILYYLYYYNGGGVAIGDVNDDGLPDIYFTANSKGNNKLYLNKGNFEFEDVTEKAGVKGSADWCTGVTMADVNSDGFLDIYVSTVSQTHNLQGHNELFINNGFNLSDSGKALKEISFTESSKKYGLDFAGFTTQTAFFDYDHDGDLDCYILNQSHQPNQNIVDTANRRKIDPFAGDRLMRNDVNSISGKFTDVSLQAGIYQSKIGYGLGIAVADLNNDGWDDIYIGNDFHENDYYYVNNGNGTFTESGDKHFNHYSRFSMGNDIGDYNNDGQLDIVTVDMLPPDEKILKTYGSDENPDIYKLKITRNGFQNQYSKNCLQRNNGNGSSFSETSLISGVSATDWSWCPLFADFDNDGNKDLFISSGIVKRPVDLDYVKFVSNLYMQKSVDKTDKYDDEALEQMPDGSSHPFLFKGDGKLSFTDVTSSCGFGKLKGYFNGAAYGDLDNDGNLDLVINCLNAEALILKNITPKKNYISLSFKGDNLNTSGISCKAYVFQKDSLQYQQLMLTRGFESSSDSRLHFGLGSSTFIDSVLVVWPDQTFQILKKVSANQQLLLDKKNASGVFSEDFLLKSKPAFLTSINSDSIIKWRHKENNFIDFNTQYLIPHSESTRGPKIAVGDINDDSLNDFYVCGAKGQPGALMIQENKGIFKQIDTSIFATDAKCEDVDAIFFDANGDHSLDLYVVSGGNEYNEKDSLLADRLYLNHNGHFTKALNSLPLLFQNKSCVVAADIDKDGDTDLFIGSLANSKAYGIPQTSYLLINDGQAHFSIANDNTISLSNIGIVTSAVFTDVNKDGWSDLVIACEWMGITVFINNHGKFTSSIIPASTGWWQTLYADDVNNDGNMDILAGNWGLNNKFSSGKNGPVKLYVSDFDGNGQVDQLMSYTLDGEEYPFLAKDEVERQLPLLKKHYLKYAEYAGVPMKDVFYGWIDTTKPLIAERLASTVCFGDGNGGFTLKSLPDDLQLSPIFSFKKINSTSSGNQYLAGGNFYDVIPYEGRYDAQPLALFSINKKNDIQYIPQSNLSSVQGQVRAVNILDEGKTNQQIIIAMNNGPLLFYKNNIH